MSVTDDIPALPCHLGRPSEEVRRTLAGAPVAAVVVCLLERRVVWHNEAASSIADRCGCQLLGQRLVELFAEEDAQRLSAVLDDVERGDRAASDEPLSCEGFGGKRVAVHLRCSAVAGPPDAPEQVAIYLWPLGDSSRWVGEGAVELMRAPALLDGPARHAAVTDAAGRVRAVTSAALEALATPRVLGQSITDLAADPIGAASVEALLGAVRAKPAGSRVSALARLRLREDADGEEVGPRSCALSVEHRAHDPSVRGLLWHWLVLEDCPLHPSRERDLRAYADFLEHRLGRVALELRRAGIAVGGEAEVRGPILGLGSLTAREREVFELLVSGLRVSSIARSLYLSESTVRSHVSAVFRKLGVRSQSELMERVASQGGERDD